MKLSLGRRFCPPIMLAAGDFISLAYVQVDGVIRREHETPIGGMTPDRQIMVDESLMFETEIKGRRAIGVMLLEVTPEEKTNVDTIAPRSEPERYRR